MLRATALLLVLGVLAAPGSTPRAYADDPAPTSGPVLYQPSETQYWELGYNLYANLLSTDGTDLQLPQKSSTLDDGTFGPSPWVVAKFSPDGASVATPKCVALDDCNDDESWALEITTAAGDDAALVGALPEYPVDLSWSPDGSAIAVLVRNPTSAPFEPHYRILRVDVATGAQTLVVDSTSDLSTNSTFDVEGSGISWGPSGAIAFIGSKTVNGSYGIEDVYTVSAAGGTPVRYNGVFPDDDVHFDDRYCEGHLAVGYHQPAWSPDGQSIAARMILNDIRATCDDDGMTFRCDSRNQLVELTPGAETPSVLADLPVELYPEDPENPGICRRAYMDFQDWQPEPVWNLDGAHVMYGYAPPDSTWAGDGVQVRIVDTTTLIETTPVTMADVLEADDLERRYIGYYKDWQPCPTGTCVRWANVDSTDLVAHPQSLVSVDSQDVPITLTGHDSDGRPLSYTVTQGPTHGSLTGTPPAVTYTPQPAFEGVDSFTFVVSAGDDVSAPATVTIDVTAGCTIEGDAKNNTLIGTSGDDVICGEGGKDVIDAKGGQDILRGGDGDDQLIGGPGNDRILGQAGADVMRGDAGNDVIDGGADQDLTTYFTSSKPLTINLGTGRAVSPDHGRDSLVSVERAFGSKGPDVMVGGARPNALYGGPGNDRINAGDGPDYLQGNAGNDILDGGPHGDLLQGDDGADRLSGGAARDVCYDHLRTTRRSSCESGGESDPAKTKPPGGGPRNGQTGGTPRRGVARAAGGMMYWWGIGNDDFLVLYDRAATRQIGSWAATSGWEGQLCRFVRYSPARGVCSVNGAFNSVQKYQMKWFLWNAKYNGGCAIGILDWGRHGVNQFSKRWKTRPAEFGDIAVAVPYLTAGRTTYLRANKKYFNMRCP